MQVGCREAEEGVEEVQKLETEFTNFTERGTGVSGPSRDKALAPAAELEGSRQQLCLYCHQQPQLIVISSQSHVVLSGTFIQRQNSFKSPITGHNKTTNNLRFSLIDVGINEGADETNCTWIMEKKSHCQLNNLRPSQSASGPASRSTVLLHPFQTWVFSHRLACRQSIDLCLRVFRSISLRSNLHHQFPQRQFKLLG